MTGRRSYSSVWEWLDSSEADTMPRCYPAKPASGSEEGELCAFSSIPIRTLISRG